jgi:hypothetical protein
MGDETRERLKREGWILWMKCRPVLDACRPLEDALEALRSEEEAAQVARLRRVLDAIEAAFGTPTPEFLAAERALDPEADNPLHQTPLDWPDDR